MLALFVLRFAEERGFAAHWGEDLSEDPSFYLELSLLIDCFFKLYILPVLGKHSLVFQYFCVVHAWSIVLKGKKMHLP